MAAKKTIVVTGTTGRIGRYIARDLIERGHVVRSVVKSKEGLLKLPAGTVPYIGSIEERSVLNEAFEGADAVIHLAGIVSEYKSTTEQILKTNVVATREVVAACEANGVKKLLFPSSVDVYGRVRKDVLTEESELKPTDKYGYSKMLAENVIRDEAAKLKYTIFRLAVVYGPGFEHSFFKLLTLIQSGKAYIVGNGENHLALLHVSDAATAFVKALESRDSDNQVYNLSDGENRTQRYLFELAAELLKVPKPTKQISTLIMDLMARTRNIDSDELRFLTSDRQIDISKIRKELGFRPSTGIRKGAGDLVERFREEKVHHAPIVDVQ